MSLVNLVRHRLNDIASRTHLTGLRLFAFQAIALIAFFAIPHPDALAITAAEAMATCQATADRINQPGDVLQYGCFDVGITDVLYDGSGNPIGFESQVLYVEEWSVWIPNGINDCPSSIPNNWVYCTIDFSYYYGAISRTADPGCNGVGNPISPATGLKTQREAIFNVGELALSLTYRSGDPYPVYGTSQRSFGDHWVGNYGAHVYLITGPGTPAAGNSSAGFALRPDGRALTFNSAALAGPYTMTGDTSDRLQSVVDGSGNLLGWTYTTADDTFEQYDSQGNLQSIASRDGHVSTLTYSDGTAVAPNGATYIGSSTPLPAGMLLHITDSFGRQITYDYDMNARVTQVLDPTGQAYRISYDTSGNLSFITYPDTRQKQYLYNESVYTGGANLPNALTGILDENGQRYATYTYDSFGDATGTQHGSGVENYALSWGTLQSSLNAATQATVTDPSGTSRTYTFQSLAGGRVVPTSMSLQCPGCSFMSSKTLNYDPNGNVTYKQDFNNSFATYVFDTTRNLETQRIEAQAYGTGWVNETREVSTRWHPNWRLTAATAEANRITTYVYNGDTVNGQQVLCAPADALVAGLPIGVLCSKTIQATTDANGSETFNAAPTGTPRTWNYTYNSLGQKLSVDGPRTDVSDTSTYEYYTSTDLSGCGTFVGPCHHSGDLYTETDALGHVTTYVTYDQNGHVTRARDANGTYSDMTYSSRGWLLTRTVRANADGSANTAADAKTTTDYDYAGQLTKVTSPDGTYVMYGYDAAHRLTDITDNLGQHTHYTLDGYGNRTNESTYDASNALKRTSSRQYDQLNQLLKTLNAGNIATQTNQNPTDAPPSGLTYTDGYDGNGNAVYSVDALGVGTFRQYDRLNRLIKVRQDHTGKSAATKNATTQYVYDAHSNVLSQTDPDNLITGYTYDGFDDVLQLSSPDTGNTDYTYDLAGNRLTQTDAKSITATSTFDALNRITSTTYPTATLNVTYVYDQPGTGCFNVGKLSAITDNTGSTSFCYDRRGNLLSKTQVTNGVSLKVVYTYTTADRLSSIIYPSGSVVRYGRDTLGRVNLVQYQPSGGTNTTLVSNVSYYPFGPVNVITFANGRTLTKTYDQNYWIDKIVSSNASGLIVDATVDALGNVINASSTVGASKPTQNYTYDPLYRITGVTSSTGSTLEAFSYNATGDRLSKTLGTQTSTYGYAGHRLASINSVPRNYDLNGNTLAIATGQLPTFTFDDRNRMASVHASNTPQTCKGKTCTGGSDVSAQYGYNARGERVYKNVITTSSGTTTSAQTGYVYAEAGMLLGEYPAGTSNVAPRDYVYMDGVPVGYATGGVLYYVESDQLSTPRVTVKAGATPSNDTTVWKWDYLANNSVFGENAPSVQSVAFNLRYPGQYFDSETGLIYNRARDYEPGTGRYVESDPIGLGGGLSTYSYAGDRALNEFDATGLVHWTGHWTFSAVSAGEGGFTAGTETAVAVDVKNDCKPGQLQYHVYLKGSDTDVNAHLKDVGHSWSWRNLSPISDQGGGSVDLNDGQAQASPDNLAGTLNISTQGGYFSASGTMTAGGANGTVTVRGVNVGDFSFRGRGVLGPFSKQPDYCDCCDN